MQNLSSALPRSGAVTCRQRLAAHDRLPAPARRWACGAALPWSAASVARLWRKALRESGGCEVQALASLNAAEARLLRRDAAQIWGEVPGGPAR